MKRIFPIIVLAVLLQCCSREPGSRPEVEKDQLVDLLVDIHLTDSYLSYRNFPGKWPKHNDVEQAYGYILAKYNITPVQFKNTMTYYGRHIKEYEQIYNKVIEKLTKYETEIDNPTNSDKQSNQKSAE